MKRKITTRARGLLAVLAVGALTTLMPVRIDAATTDELDRFVASLEGGWMGDDNMTPFGKMGFATLFKRLPDGSLHSRSSLNSETYIDLLFSKDSEGRWILREEASMEGLGVQAYSLVPAGDGASDLADGMHRWIYEEDPEFLTIDVGRAGDTFLLDVMLRGREHVAFRLDRLPDDALPEMEREMEAASRRAPSEGTSIADVVEHAPAFLASGETGHETSGAGAEASHDPGEPVDPVDAARRAIAESPTDGEAHLALARVLGEAIDADPANGPRFAFEMRAALVKAIELDPSLAEAYHWLVGYYLNAPPIAGGSVDEAEKTARRLAELDPEGGRVLLEQVAARRSDSR